MPGACVSAQLNGLPQAFCDCGRSASTQRLFLPSLPASAYLFCRRSSLHAQLGYGFDRAMHSSWPAEVLARRRYAPGPLLQLRGAEVWLRQHVASAYPQYCVARPARAAARVLSLSRCRTSTLRRRRFRSVSHAPSQPLPRLREARHQVAFASASSTARPSTR